MYKTTEIFVTIENVFFCLIFTPTHLVFGFLIFIYIYIYIYIRIYIYKPLLLISFPQKFKNMKI